MTRNKNRRQFIKESAIVTVGGIYTLSSCNVKNLSKAPMSSVRTAHIGLGIMGTEDLANTASHRAVQVVALCDVDSGNLSKAAALYPNAKTYTDYRVMLEEMKDGIDAVVVSTPDHTHAPASLLAMKHDMHVYCQKPLTHHVSEAREMNKVALEKSLVTQMGIQVHSFYDYKLGTILIQNGIIGKVSEVHAWSPKNWGYDGEAPSGSDPIPEGLDWDLWLGTAPERPYKKGHYHPSNWRKIMDFGCGTLGDMGVHIFDTPYNALELDVPLTIINECRSSNGYGFPEKNKVVYEFPGTKHTTEKLKWIWYDGEGAPDLHDVLNLPDGEVLPDQGAMFVGEKGRLLLPHFMQMPKLIVDGKYMDIDLGKYGDAAQLDPPVRDYNKSAYKHYHQFVDTILGTDACTAPFSYASRLTETILLGVIAGRFPGKTLHWDRVAAQFAESEANQYLGGNYRSF